MKRVIILLLATCLTSFTGNRTKTQDILAGTWKHKSGNEVFIVNLWRVPEGYRGHYRKITVDAKGNQIAEIYNSDKPIGNTATNWSYVIFAGSISVNYEIRAIIHDNTVANVPNAGGFIQGVLDMKILNPKCFVPATNACPLQVQWKIKKDAGLQNPDEPDFDIPTDIVLTKQ